MSSGESVELRRELAALKEELALLKSSADVWRMAAVADSHLLHALLKTHPDQDALRAAFAEIVSPTLAMQDDGHQARGVQQRVQFWAGRLGLPVPLTAVSKHN